MRFAKLTDQIYNFSDLTPVELELLAKLMRAHRIQPPASAQRIKWGLLWLSGAIVDYADRLDPTPDAPEINYPWPYRPIYDACTSLFNKIDTYEPHHIEVLTAAIAYLLWAEVNRPEEVTFIHEHLGSPFILGPGETIEDLLSRPAPVFDLKRYNDFVPTREDQEAIPLYRDAFARALSAVG